MLKRSNILKRPSGIFRTRKSKRRILEKINPADLWLNIGSGSTNYGNNFINIDISSFKNVNIVGDAHLLPFKTGSFKGVWIQGVCEHVRNPEIVVNEIYRILKIDGYIYAEIPFIQGFHPDPEDFQRYTIQGIEELFDKFERKDSGTCVGPASGFVWILREFLAMLFCFNNYYLYKILRYFFSWLTFPISLVDFFLENSKFGGVIASSLYFYGRKSGQKH